MSGGCASAAIFPGGRDEQADGGREAGTGGGAERDGRGGAFPVRRRQDRARLVADGGRATRECRPPAASPPLGRGVLRGRGRRALPSRRARADLQGGRLRLRAGRHRARLSGRVEAARARDHLRRAGAHRGVLPRGRPRGEGNAARSRQGAGDRRAARDPFPRARGLRGGER